MDIKLEIDPDYCQGNGSCLWTDDDEEVYEDTSVKRVRKLKSIKVGRAKN
jgi:ferredoxin